MRQEQLAPIFRDAFIPQHIVETDVPSTAKVVDEQTASDVDGTAEVTSDLPDAYPMIQPMKAAFHFDSVEGFGEWQILISGRADRDLRAAKRSDQKLFGIILKKIR